MLLTLPRFVDPRTDPFDADTLEIAARLTAARREFAAAHGLPEWAVGARVEAGRIEAYQDTEVPHGR